jgi:hypothetical protein
MEALTPLARTSSYGSVREVRAEYLVRIIDALFERIVVGLAPACSSLDDAAAVRMLDAIVHVHESVALLDRAEQRDEWAGALRAVLAREGAHGLVRGGVCRLLFDQKTVGEDELGRLARVALSPANPPAQAAAWVEGLLRGSALLLLHHDGVWRALDHWLTSLGADAFVEMLPLVRRAFATFGTAERRQMGDKVKKIGSDAPSSPGPPSIGDDFDSARAALVHPVLSQILGVEIA